MIYLPDGSEYHGPSKSLGRDIDHPIADLMRVAQDVYREAVKEDMRLYPGIIEALQGVTLYGPDDRPLDLSKPMRWGHSEYFVYPRMTADEVERVQRANGVDHYGEGNVPAPGQDEDDEPCPCCYDDEDS